MILAGVEIRSSKSKRFGWASCWQKPLLSVWYSLTLASALGSRVCVSDKDRVNRTPNWGMTEPGTLPSRTSRS